MVNLFINYYQDRNAVRQSELDFCLRNNVNNPLIDRIYLYICSGEEPKTMNSDKFRIYNREGRPTYNDFFSLMDSETYQEDINILANTDIYFNETLRNSSIITYNDCYALSRWNFKGPNEFEHFNRPDSQDTWIFRGKIKPIDAPFSLGKPGCDNRLAYLLQVAGYNVINFSRMIQTIHVHASEIRNYAPADTIPGPYKFLLPQ